MKKLKSLDIKGLFGHLDYSVDFAANEGFSILAAPNGYGKSTILQIIRSVFAGNPFYFSNLNFKEIEIVFIDSERSLESKLSIVKTIVKDHSEYPILEDESADVYAGEVEYRVDFVYGDKTFSFTHKDIETLVDIVDDKIEDLENVTETTAEQLSPVWKFVWDKKDEFPLFDISDLYYRYNDVFKDSVPWLVEFKEIFSEKYLFVSPNHTISFGDKSVKVKLDNLRDIMYGHRPLTDKEGHLMVRRGVTFESSVPKSTPDTDRETLFKIVDQLCEEVAPAEVRFRKYNGRHIEDLNNVYEPVSLMFNCPEESDTVEQLREKETLLRAYLLYYHSVDRAIEKMELFEKTANKLLSFKRVRITFTDFWVDVKETWFRLQANKISTGEEHLLLLLGYILFEASYKGHVVLMDEPETSLHPSWQKALANFCWEVHEKYGVEFIFATHSPTFVGTRWDKVVELSHLL